MNLAESVFHKNTWYISNSIGVICFLTTCFFLHSVISSGSQISCDSGSFRLVTHCQMSASHLPFTSQMFLGFFFHFFKKRKEHRWAAPYGPSATCPCHTKKAVPLSEVSGSFSYIVNEMFPWNSQRSLDSTRKKWVGIFIGSQLEILEVLEALEGHRTFAH